MFLVLVTRLNHLTSPLEVTESAITAQEVEVEVIVGTTLLVVVVITAGRLAVQMVGERWPCHIR
jgi:hypothetical protein